MWASEDLPLSNKGLIEYCTDLTRPGIESDLIPDLKIIIVAVKVEEKKTKLCN